MTVELYLGRHWAAENRLIAKPGAGQICEGLRLRIFKIGSRIANAASRPQGRVASDGDAHYWSRVCRWRCRLWSLTAGVITPIFPTVFGRGSSRPQAAYFHVSIFPLARGPTLRVDTRFQTLGPSPNRADALVWAIAWIGPARPE